VLFLLPAEVIRAIRFPPEAPDEPGCAMQRIDPLQPTKPPLRSTCSPGLEGGRWIDGWWYTPLSSHRQFCRPQVRQAYLPRWTSAEVGARRCASTSPSLFADLFHLASTSSTRHIAPKTDKLRRRVIPIHAAIRRIAFSPMPVRCNISHLPAVFCLGG